MDHSLTTIHHHYVPLIHHPSPTHPGPITGPPQFRGLRGLLLHGVRRRLHGTHLRTLAERTVALTVVRTPREDMEVQGGWLMLRVVDG